MTNKTIKQNKSQVPLQTGFFYGWLIVLVSGMGIFFSGPGQTFSNSVFIQSYMQDFNMSQTELSFIYSAATLTSGLMLFFVGRLIDRFGRRLMLAIAALLLGVACFYNSFVTGPIMLFFGFFMIRYFGQGSLTLIPNTLVSQWFVKYRGRALSFAGIGGLLGAASFPPLINWMIDAYGWQHTWRILGTTLIVFFMPIALYIVRNSPEDVGLLPDGVKNESDPKKRVSTVIQEESWTLSEAMRTRAFWFIMICGAIPAMINTGITFQIFSIFSEKGISRMETAFVLSLIPIVSFSCSLLSGFIVEQVKVNRMLSLTFAVSIATPIILIFAQSYAIIILFAIVWGVAQGFMNIPLGVIWANYYGRQHLGSIQSMTQTAGIIGSAIGPIQFGLAYDQFGSYTSVLIISSVIWAFGSVLSYFAAPPNRKKQR